MNNIETKWLRDFITLAELGSFSQAASARNITQPAFSRRIKSLESELNLVLIDRSKTPIELTTSGKQFKTTAESILFQLDEEVGRLSGSSVRGRHTVRLNAAHSIAIGILPQIHEGIFNPALNTNLSIVASEVDTSIERLIDGKSDFLFSFYDDRLQVAPYQSIYLGRSFLYCVSVADSEGKPLFDISENDDVPSLAYTSDSYMGRALNKAQQALTKNIVSTSSMSDLNKEFVLQGKGISWLPDYTIKKELESGQLVILKEKEPVPLDLYVYRYVSKLHPTCEAIWSQLIKISPIKELSGLNPRFFS
ncbi:LysR substrate-binding domain-containing protein [Vibrio hannami]|uniref:LysR family transcriptional regulator n=1 Tax=Vibrio hannami TaxID=2717094 RepID=UPI00240F37F1|nr:LysR family transcriptional regulator [Vibrio hannami]MDG3086106.1 LysR substrate-binding domain-containing protein [Vibrio hannami]